MLDEKNLIGKKIKNIQIGGFGIYLVLDDGTILDYKSSGEGNSCWDIMKKSNYKARTGVYIKGMEMPYNCLDCDFSKVQTYDSTIRCCVPSEESFGENVTDFTSCRPQFCPLVEIILGE